MAAKPIARINQPSDQPLNAGVTLVELVVSVAIIGTLGLSAAILMVQLSETYIGTRSQSLEQMRYQLALEQMAKEIAQCLPATLVIGESNDSLQIETIVTGGVASTITSGEMTDPFNPQLGRIHPGTIAIFRPSDPSPVRAEITSVNIQQGTIRATGITDNLPYEYWIVRSKITYSRSEGTLIRTETATGGSSVLCEGIAEFEVTAQADHAVRIILRGVSASTKESWIQQKLVALP